MTYYPNEDPRVRAVVDLLTKATIAAAHAERDQQRYQAGLIGHYPQSTADEARHAQAACQNAIYDLASALRAEIPTLPQERLAKYPELIDVTRDGGYQRGES